jgi:hypothetical protein
MLREQAALNDRWTRLPLPDGLKRVNQHDDVQGKVVTDMKPDQNFERQC